MGSDSRTSKQEHTSAASKVETKKTKTTRSKDKKTRSKGSKGGSKDKKEKRKGLKMPMDYEPGPEGEDPPMDEDD